MDWGWIKALWSAIFGSIKEGMQSEVKSTEAKTTNETKQRFNTLRSRIKPTAPPEPPADGDPRHH